MQKLIWRRGTSVLGAYFRLLFLSHREPAQNFLILILLKRQSYIAF